MAVRGCERHQGTLGRRKGGLVGELRLQRSQNEGHLIGSHSTARRTPEEAGRQAGDSERRHPVGASNLKGLHEVNAICRTNAGTFALFRTGS